MSGLGILAPIGFFALISLPVIYLFHMRHSTPLRRVVPTLRFWQSAAPVQSEDPRFRIPPLSLSLLLQLLAAAALAIGLAQPVIAGSLGGLTHRTDPVHLVVLLDGSTSMTAQDTPDGKTRFDLARQDVLNRVGELRQGDTATVMVLGTQNVTLGATDPGDFKSLSEQLASLPSPGGVADLDSALKLVADLAVPDMQEEIALYSDGAVTADPVIVSSLPGTLVWKEFGRASSPNLAITEIVPRSAPGASGDIELFLQIANFSPNPVETVLLVQADGVEVTRQTLTVDPTRPADVTVNGVSSDTRRIVAEVQSQDALFADNQATIVFAESGGSEISVLLVSDLPGASQRALASVPGTVVTTVGSAEYANRSVSVAGFDLVVFDGVLPPGGQVPNRPVIFIDPPRGGILPDNGMITTPEIESVRTDDPILNDVDLSGVSFRETPAFELAASSEPIVESAEGPLIFRGVAPESGQTMVVISFDLAESNLPSRIAFPILMSNIVNSLAPSSLPLTCHWVSRSLCHGQKTNRQDCRSVAQRNRSRTWSLMS